MPWKNDPNIWEMLGALSIALMSGFIAVANQLAGGQKFSVLWLAAQTVGAVLVGYLMWDAYPLLVTKTWWPEFMTMPISVALAGHYGGKVFSVAEKLFRRKLNIPEELA